MSEATQMNPFGECPECGESDGYLNIGREHWFVCHEHRIKWFVGSNLFSGWRHEEESEWEQNEQTLSGYREVLSRDEEKLGQIHEEDIAREHEDEDLYWKGRLA